MSIHINIPWDQILHLFLSLFESIWTLITQLSQQVSSQFGTLGQMGVILIGGALLFWLFYQILRLLAFIMIRIVLPVGLVIFALFLLTVLSS
jgi:hypothetical protein